jgi:tRNA(fMet)-specific endonuclease VapC
MTLLDTDILTHLMNGHERVRKRAEQAESIAITIVTRVEVLQGRFASLLKAADGEHLLLAQQWLEENERYLRGVQIVRFDAAAGDEFDKLRQNKKLKKIGRADLLIASIALAHQATLATHGTRSTFNS